MQTDNYAHTDLCSGCELDECSDHGSGCAEWRRWFIEWWDTNIHRDFTEPKHTKQVFQYKHPDEKEE